MSSTSALFSGSGELTIIAPRNSRPGFISDGGTSAKLDSADSSSGTSSSLTSNVLVPRTAERSTNGEKVSAADEAERRLLIRDFFLKDVRTGLTSLANSIDDGLPTYSAFALLLDALDDCLDKLARDPIHTFILALHDGLVGLESARSIGSESLRRTSRLLTELSAGPVSQGSLAHAIRSLEETGLQSNGLQFPFGGEEEAIGELDED